MNVRAVNRFAIFLLSLLTGLLCCEQALRAQQTFYSDVFRGGMTGDGFSPGKSGSGGGLLKVHIAPGSTIRQAFLLAGRHGPAGDLNIRFNGQRVSFQPQFNQISPTFQSPRFGGESGVHAFDVTSMVDADQLEYPIDVPGQSPSRNRYSDFYLVILYNNPDLPQIRAQIFLNNKNFSNAPLQYRLKLPEPRCRKVALALMCGYICNTIDDYADVFVNSEHLGRIGGSDGDSFECGGPAGSFYYENGLAQGLEDDDADRAMTGTDLLSTISDLANSTDNDIILRVEGKVDNALWAMFTAYESFDFDITVAEGSLPLCPGDRAVLDAGAGFNSYLWSTGETTRRISVSDTGSYAVRVSSTRDCSSSRSIDIKFFERPSLSIPGDILDFGILDGCLDARSNTMNITNEGQDSIVLQNLELDNEHFDLIDEPAAGSIIRPGESLKLRIRFRPSKTGREDATLTLTAQPCDLVYRFSLRGRKGNNTVGFALNSVNFGSHALCSDALSDTLLLVKNFVSQPLIIDLASTAAPFEVTSSLPRLLEAGDTMHVRLRFSPILATRYQESLELAFASDNGSCTGVIAVALEGEARNGTESLQAPALVVPPMLGCIESIDTNITITNRGQATIRLDSVRHSDVIEVRSILPIDIPARTDRSILLRLSPPLGQHREGMTLFTDECGGTFFVQLQTNRLNPRIDLPDTVDFGNIALCGLQDSTIGFTVRPVLNSGSAAILRSLAIDGPFDVSLQVGDEFPVDRRTEISINYRPTEVGEDSGTIELTFDPCAVKKTIHIRGRNQPALLSIEERVDLGRVRIRERAQEIVVLHNRGVADQIVTAVNGVAPPFFARYAAGGTSLPDTVSPGDSLLIEIGIRGSRAGRYRDTLHIHSSAPNCRPRIDLPISAIVADAGEIILRLPELRYDLAKRDALIPILVVGLRERDFPARTFEAAVRLDGQVFNPTGVQGVDSSDITKDGSEYVISFRATLDRSPLPGDTLALIVGDVLYAAREVTDLTFESFSWLDSSVDSETQNGSLHVSGLCLGHGLQYYEPSRILGITPNPGRKDISIAFQIDRYQPTILQLYSLSGRRIISLSWPAAGVHGNNRFSTKLPDRLPPGAYHLVLSSGDRVESSLMIVAD